MTEGGGGFYSCYFKNEYGEAVSSGWVEVMETLPVHQKMHDKHHHGEKEEAESSGDVNDNSVLLLSTVIGAVVGLLLAALALLFCTKYQVICFCFDVCYQ